MFLTCSSSRYYTNSISLQLLVGLGPKRKTRIHRLRTIDCPKQESIWGKALIRWIIAREGQESCDYKQVFSPLILFSLGLSPWQVKWNRFSPNQRGFHVPSKAHTGSFSSITCTFSKQIHLLTSPKRKWRKEQESSTHREINSDPDRKARGKVIRVQMR